MRNGFKNSLRLNPTTVLPGTNAWLLLCCCVSERNTCSGKATIICNQPRCQ